MDVVTRSARPCAGVRRNPSGRGIASSRVWVLAGSLAMGCSPAASPGGPAPAAATAPPAPERTPTVAERLEAILDADLRARPVYATQQGDHRFDGTWPDASAAGRRADRARIGAGLAELAAMADALATPDEEVDHAMVRHALALQAFEHDVERPWQRDASWVVGLVGQGLEDLVSRPFAPLPDRARSLAERLESLPTLLEQARAQLDPAVMTIPHLEVAIGQCDGLGLLLGATIPAAIAPAPTPMRERIAQATIPATAALGEFRATLERLRPEVRGEWRLGAEAFATKLELTLQSGISAEELRRLAMLEHRRVRDAMAEAAEALAPHVLRPAQRRRFARMDPSSTATRLTAAVLEALAEAHGSAEELRDDAAATLAPLAAFVQEHALVSLDPTQVLEVIWTPPHQRGVFVAGLAAPGPLEPESARLPSFYYVQPPPPTWSAEVLETYLREYNTFMLEILSIHEAIPGHFVQLYHAARSSTRSRVRAAYPNPAFIEGWAVYAESLMVEHGYPGRAPERPAPRAVATVLEDPTLRAKAIALHGLKFYLRTVTNAILDHGVHAGEMSHDDAIALMVEASFQQEGEAESKWIRAQVTSAQLSTYFAGAQAWKALRAAAEAEAQARQQPLALAAFHDAALSHGAPPLPLLASLMRDAPSPGDGARADAASAPRP